MEWPSTKHSHKYCMSRYRSRLMHANLNNKKQENVYKVFPFLGRRVSGSSYSAHTSNIYACIMKWHIGKISASCFLFDRHPYSLSEKKSASIRKIIVCGRHMKKVPARKNFGKSSNDFLPAKKHLILKSWNSKAPRILISRIRRCVCVKIQSALSPTHSPNVI